MGLASPKLFLICCIWRVSLVGEHRDAEKAPSPQISGTLGSLVTFKDSAWLIGIVVPHQPHFLNQVCKYSGTMVCSPIMLEISSRNQWFRVLDLKL